MKILSSRFGELECREDDILVFPEGVLGFGALKKYVLVEDPSEELFMWIQSCDEKSVAFPVLEPELFNPSYKPQLLKNDLEALELKNLDGTMTLTIITIPEDPTQMTANLKAPIIINQKQKIARQCVLQDNDLAIKEPIFQQLQQSLIKMNQSAVTKDNPNTEESIHINKKSPEMGL